MESHPQAMLHPTDFTAVNRHKNSAIFCVKAHYSLAEIRSLSYTLRNETVSSSETV